jgi:hypothetical protein
MFDVASALVELEPPLFSTGDVPVEMPVSFADDGALRR